jgi:hypothetical protein
MTMPAAPKTQATKRAAKLSASAATAAMATPMEIRASAASN